TRAGGTPALTGEDAAVLVPPGDPRRLADAVRAVLTDEMLAARLRKAAAARALALPDEDAAVLAALAEYGTVTRLHAPRGPASVPPGAGRHPEGRVDAVEEVGHRHHQHQRPELPLVVVPGGLGPDLVGDRARPVGEPGGRLGERQRGPLGVVEARVLVPGGQGEQLLRADAGLGRVRGARVDAGAAAVDL